jgi:hypothetical protein
LSIEFCYPSTKLLHIDNHATQVFFAVSQFDDGRADLTKDLDVKSIRDFINANRLALVTEFTQEAAGKIFGGDVKNHLLLFVSKNSEDFKAKYDTFKEVAADYKGKVRVTYLWCDSSYVCKMHSCDQKRFTCACGFIRLELVDSLIHCILCVPGRYNSKQENPLKLQLPQLSFLEMSMPNG